LKIKGKKVLITGAGGFVGSHLAEALVKEGAKVRALVHYNSRNDWGMLEDVSKTMLNHIQVVAGELKDTDCVREAVRDQQMIFHLGALIGIPYSYVSIDGRNLKAINTFRKTKARADNNQLVFWVCSRMCQVENLQEASSDRTKY